MPDDTPRKRTKSPLLLGCLFISLASIACCVVSYVLLEGQSRENIRARRDLILNKMPDGPQTQQLAEDYDAYLAFIDSDRVDILSTSTLDNLTEGTLLDLEVSESEAWVLSWAMRRTVERGEMSLEDSKLLGAVYNREVSGLRGGPLDAARFRFEQGETSDQLSALEEMAQGKGMEEDLLIILREVARNAEPEFRVQAARMLRPREEPNAMIALLLEFQSSDFEACRGYAEVELPRLIAESPELDPVALAARIPALEDEEAAALIRLIALAPASRSLPPLVSLLEVDLPLAANAALLDALGSLAEDLPEGLEVSHEVLWSLCCESGPRLRELGRRLLAGQPNSAEEREARFAPLLDLEAWSAASAEARQKATLEGLRRLGERFACLGLTESSCGGRTYTIGRFTHLASEIELSLIPGGRFKTNDYAVKVVHIRRPFLIARFELSRAELGRLRGVQATERPTWPATDITWEQSRRLLAEAGLRLPSETEWEYAARGGSQGQDDFWSGEELERYAWRDGELHPADGHAEATNAYGLADTSGNVSEWCEDDSVDGDAGQSLTEAPVKDDDETLKMTRGGSYVEFRTSTMGDPVSPDTSNGFTGVRPACSIPSLD